MQVNSENEALSASRGSLNNSGEGSDIKGSPSEARTSTLRDPSRPKRAVPPVPSSLGSLKKEEEKELETKQGSVTDDNAESVVLPLASPGTDSFDEGDSNGQQIWFNGTYVTEGTTPKGSTWSRNPIPRNDIGGSGVGFAPPCLAYGLDASQCQGEGDGGTALVNFEIVDRIVIPAGTPPGAYVLGWRWSVI